MLADFDAARALLAHFIREASRGHYFSRKEVIVCVPLGATAVEMDALMREAEAAGADRVDLVREPFAAALGAGLPISEARGNLVIDIGGGTTEVTSLALNDIVYCESLRMAGNAMDEAVETLSSAPATRSPSARTPPSWIKIRYGPVYDDGEDFLFDVKGLNQTTGKAAALQRAQERHPRGALEPVARQSPMPYAAVSSSSPELAGDVFTEGAAMVRRRALLAGWAQRLHESMGLKIRISNEPLMCVMRGLIEISQHRDQYEPLLVNSRGKLAVEA